RAAFFNFRRTHDGWVCDESEVHANDLNVHRLLGDHGTPMVSADYEYPNDGTSAGNTVRIVNKLPHDFYNGRIRFLLKKGRYAIDGGDILAQYDAADGERTAVLVNVNIRKNAEMRVSARACADR